MSASQSPSRAEIARILIGEDDGSNGRFGWLTALLTDLWGKIDTNPDFRSFWEDDDPSAAWEARRETEALVKDLRKFIARLSRQSESHDNGSTVAQGERERIKRILGSWPMHKDDRGPDNLVLADMLPGGYEEQDAMLGQIADALISQGREQSTAGEAVIQPKWADELLARLASVERERDELRRDAELANVISCQLEAERNASRTEVQALTEALCRAESELREAADKFWVLHSNMRSNPSLKPDDKTFSLSMSHRMQAEADRVRTVLASLSDRPAQGEK
jgi:hypothetical protein